MCFRPAQASMPVKCPSCGAVTSPDTGSCEKCGAPLEGAQSVGVNQQATLPVRCPGCNSINPGTAQKCSKCGGSLEGAPSLGGTASAIGAPPVMPAPMAPKAPKPPAK